MSGVPPLSALGSRRSAEATAVAGSREPRAESGEALRLRGVARDLEGVFVEQLFKAMRETVPEGGVIDGGSGEEMFTGMLDQRLSALTPERWEGGLGNAVYRQLGGVPSSPAPVAPILNTSSSTDASRPEPS